jgi:hypothetical protein
VNGTLTFDALRGELRARWPEWTTLSAYAALVAFAIPYHEPWADEAEAWQLARTLSLPSLFQTYIRCEGAPGLWHFLLWVLVRLHIGYAGLHWICGAIAAGATALLVFKSPFPRYLKLALPFTYFLLFQYAVVARSYVLVPLLLYLIALCWKRSPWVLALLLGLLANVALHAAVISGGLAIAYFLDQARNGEVKSARRGSQLLRSALILLGFWAFALWTAWPPRDLANHLSYVMRPIWPAYPARALASLVIGLCQPWVLSILFWIAVAFCFRARRSLFYLLPVLFFAVFSGVAGLSWWHIGLLVPLLICLFWITWPAYAGKFSRSEAAGRIALIAMAGSQILWSAFALQFDHYNAFSPDLAAAEYLRPFVQQGARIAVTYSDDPKARGSRSVGILPYFDHNIFINLPEPFTLAFRNQDPTEEAFAKVFPTRPDLVVVETHADQSDIPVNLRTPRIRELEEAGYRFTNMFCGAMPIRFQLQEKSCHLIFQRIDSLQAPSGDKASQASGAR